MEARMKERFGKQILDLTAELAAAKKQIEVLIATNDALRKDMMNLKSTLESANCEEIKTLRMTNEQLKVQLVEAEEKVFNLMLEKIIEQPKPVKPVDHPTTPTKVEVTIIVPQKTHEPRIDNVPLELHSAFVNSPRSKVTKKQVVEVLHRALGHAPLGVKLSLGRNLINSLFPAYFDELKKTFPGAFMSGEKIQGIALRY